MPGANMTRPFTGVARRLPPGAIARAAQRIDVHPSALTALVTVETGNRSGFLAPPDNRPRVLYEAHRAHKLAGLAPHAVVPGLAQPQWDRSLYAATGAGEHDRLSAAIAHPRLGRAVAIQAASWGLMQVLGSNHRLAGYGDPEAFVAAMIDSEEAQLDAGLSFLVACRLVEPLRRGDWATVARGYNGTGYRQNRYDERLAAAHARALRDPDPSVLAIGDESAEVTALQLALRELGHRIGADGVFGPFTERAVLQVQETLGLPRTGRVDRAMANHLALIGGSR